MSRVSASDSEINGGEGKQEKGFYYGWVVLAVCLLIVTVNYGVRLSFGVFFKSLEEEFGWTRALTSSVFSVYMLVCALVAVLGGWAADRYGGKAVFIVTASTAFLGLALTSRVSALWQIYLSYSVLVALGTGSGYTVVTALASRWFEQRRALALGIVTSGIGLGSILMAPVASFFITSYGWRTSYVAVGLIALIVIVPLALLVRMPPHQRTAISGNERLKADVTSPPASGNILGEKFSFTKVIRTKNFVLLFIAWVFYSYCLFTVMAHIVRHAIDLNIASMQAASVVSMSGFANIPGRITMGYVSDRYGGKIAALISSSLMMVSFIWLTQATNLWMLYVFAIAFGAAYGGLAPPTTSLPGDTFGTRHIGVILGMLEVGWMFGAAMGPAVAGYIFDVTGNYSLAFWLCALAALIITMLLLFMQMRKARNR